MQNKQLSLFDLNKLDQINNKKLYEVKATNGKMVRTETINIKENKIFSKCLNVKDIKDAYEAFWNLPYALDRITVIGVKEVSQ